MRKCKMTSIFILFVFVPLFFTLCFSEDGWNIMSGVRNGVLKVMTRIKKPLQENGNILPYVIVHFDMKGAPPKLEYLEYLLPKLKNLGVNGILMEYEDTFPYEGKLASLRARNYYDKTELKSYLRKAVNEGLEIIPLIQTFGHMEHVLKLEEFRHLREDSNFSDSICPSKEESGELIKEMLTQVIKFHTSVAPMKHFHIGCDEVYHINKCPQCLQRKLENIVLFSNHVDKVTNIVKTLTPKTTILMWDDMFRELKESQWEKVSVSNTIQPVYWDYSPTLKWTNDENLQNLQKRFKDIWIASAYKGADGSTSIMPNILNRYHNHLNWLDFTMNYTRKYDYNFKGLILTGWSRYNHMSPLCDILPVALPSLIMNLILIKTVKGGTNINLPQMDFDDFFTMYLEAEFKIELNCNKNVNVIDFNSTLSCSFPGIDLHNGLKEYLHIESQLQSVSGTDKNVCNDILKSFLHLDEKLHEILDKYYKLDVIEELFQETILIESAKTILNRLCASQ